MKSRWHPRWMGLLGFGMLSACATHEQQSRQPAAPVATSVSQVWSFETEWARAATQSAPGSVGQAWERSVNRTVEAAYGAVLDGCLTEGNSDDPGTRSGQRLVLDIARSGGVREVWSETDSPLLTCARESLKRTRFAPPPMDGYRLGLELHLYESDTPTEFPREPRPMPGSISPYEARRLALLDMHAKEGQPYMQSFLATFSEFFRSRDFEKCMAIPLLETERSLRGYWLIIEIASDGTTQRTLVEPDPENSATVPFQSPRADCLRDGLSRARLPMPPWDGFWVYTGLDN